MAVLHIKRIRTLIMHIATDAQFSFIKKLRRRYPQSQTYLVGGVVRDTLLGRQTKDFDFVVRGVSLRSIEKELRTLGSVNAVGRRFGVLKFVPKCVQRTPSLEPFDIALPRTEHTGHFTGHYRDFVIKSDWRLPIEDDLSRRDFTINAMAIDLANGTLIDPFGGMNDMPKKIIRCVGKPATRFAEDYSRMLRAIRFSCQLDFTLERETSQAIQAGMGKINKKIHPSKINSKKYDANTLRAVPYETIAKELSFALSAYPRKAVQLFDCYGVFKELMPPILAMKGCVQPALWHSEGDVWTHTELCFKNIGSKRFKKEFGSHSVEPLLLWSLLFHDIGKPPALKTPEKDGVDRIRFDGHDRIGADIAKRIAERLRLASVARMDISSEDIWWLINYHLLVLNTDVARIKHTTLEKYFFRDPRRGLLLRQLVFVDTLSSKRADGKSSLGSYRALTKRLQEYEQRFHRKATLPKPIINGDEIMKALRLSPGPLVGKYILLVREEQLAKRVCTKRQALAFLKKELQLQ
ncbi:MAG: HD domain-containing protein [Patescibacteria group bacterium]